MMAATPELPSDLLAHLVAVGRRSSITVFAGAGVSAAAPCSLPLARTMTHTIVGTLCGRREDKALWMAVDRLRPERLLSVLHEVMGEEGLAPVRFLGDSKPNRNHRILATLARAGCLAAIITTNFDTAIEQALTEGGVRFQPYVLEPEYTDWGYAPLPLLKLHGSLPFGDHAGGALDAMMEQVSHSLPPEKTKVLKHLLESTNLLVAGYSGRDDFDIYPVLCYTFSLRTCTWVKHPLPTPPSRRRYRARDEDARLSYEDFVTLWAEPATTDPVDGMVDAQPKRMRVVEMDAGAALDQLCRALTGESFPEPESSQSPTAWQKAVEQWAERFHGTEVPQRLVDRLRAEGSVSGSSVLDIVARGERLIELAEEEHGKGDVERAIEHFIECLAIVSKTHSIAIVRMHTVADTPGEITPVIARRAMGQLIPILTTAEGWRFAGKALRQLDRHFPAADSRRYLRTQLLHNLRRRAASFDSEHLRWAIEMISEMELDIAIPSHVDPANPVHRLLVADRMAEHVLKIGKPMWEQLMEPLAEVDAARPRLVLDLAARWSRDRQLDRPLLPWLTALWLGRSDEEFDERLEFLEGLIGHPNNPAAQEAAAYSLRVLARGHCFEVMGMLRRLAMFHPDELVRGNLVRAVERESHCREEGIALLKQLRKDRSPHVRAMASEKLREVRGPLWKRFLGLD